MKTLERYGAEMTNPDDGNPDDGAGGTPDDWANGPLVVLDQVTGGRAGRMSRPQGQPARRATSAANCTRLVSESFAKTCLRCVSTV